MRLKKTTILSGNHTKPRDRAQSDIEMSKALHFKGDLKHHLGDNTEHPDKVYVKKQKNTE